MSKRKKKNNQHLLTSLLILIAILSGIYIEKANTSFGLSENTNKTSSNLEVSFLDVGQADSILIQNKEEFMLIDAGNNNDGDLLVDYFHSLGIEEFQYVVGTHPHEDHIGGLDTIINEFQIDKIYLPDVITTTTTFTDLLGAIENKNMTYTVPTIGETFSLGEANIEVIYTGTDTTDLNNTSIVLKLTFGNTSFLFTGDATSTTEKQILNKDINADVLKVGHHGSKYSTTDEFLNKVNPKYAIISVGKNNSYGHPNQSTLDKFKQKNIQIFRTDELGTILVTSDGETITIDSIETNTNGG